MAGGTFSSSGLRWNDPGETDWLADENYNITRINDTLLKLQNMLDCTGGTELHQHALCYNGTTFDLRYVPWGHEYYTTSTTTTTTTTT